MSHLTEVLIARLKDRIRAALEGYAYECGTTLEAAATKALEEATPDPGYSIEVGPGDQPDEIKAVVTLDTAGIPERILKALREEAVKLYPRPEGAVVEKAGLYHEILLLPTTAKIAKKRRAIRCLKCGRSSFNSNDIENHFCSHCGWLYPADFDPRLAPLDTEGHDGPGGGG